MFELSVEGWSLDKDLQIIQADVRMAVDGSILIEEPLCIDVGLPALLYSALHDTEPDRFAPPDEWVKMPFFVCGCGDPECRGFSFVVHHKDRNELELISVEERGDGTHRKFENHLIAVSDYRKQVLRIGETYLAFIQGLDYRPYYADTVKVVEELVEQLHQQ
ncbi:hypothetical protein ACFPES_29920 [Paenibacillus sp. GCM10023248]|uniref:hypothetical protein n=1 Tax=Bacillales TaxID=1385 RepID=UPI0023783F6F|nr:MULTISPECIES: hypothetical protein [Bacillales]MDD9271260.1 hypothetical protein [Paenibacillus sp. MAHUQ-63]MDR6881618.1 hypothetical protein [Bacillus sp. 3255]